jgi:hypothetical protein
MLLTEFKAAGHRALVFSQSRKMLDVRPSSRSPLCPPPYACTPVRIHVVMVTHKLPTSMSFHGSHCQIMEGVLGGLGDGFGFERLDGTVTDMRERQRIVDKYNNDASKLGECIVRSRHCPPYGGLLCDLFPRHACLFLLALRCVVSVLAHHRRGLGGTNADWGRPVRTTPPPPLHHHPSHPARGLPLALSDSSSASHRGFAMLHPNRVCTAGSVP